MTKKWKFNKEWEEKIRAIVRDEMNTWDWIKLIDQELIKRGY